MRSEGSAPWGLIPPSGQRCRAVWAHGSRRERVLPRLLVARCFARSPGATVPLSPVPLSPAPLPDPSRHLRVAPGHPAPVCRSHAFLPAQICLSSLFLKESLERGLFPEVPSVKQLAQFCPNFLKRFTSEMRQNAAAGCLGTSGFEGLWVRGTLRRWAALLPLHLVC